MGAIASSLPLSEDATFSIERSVAVASAIGLWLWSELSSHPRTPHPHDVKLFVQTAPLIDPDLDWLRDHDFGNSFPAHRGKGLYRIADEWRGPAYRFHDRKLAAAWSATHQAIDDLTRQLVTECGPVPSNSALFTVKTTQDFELGQRSKRTLDAAAKLNAAAALVAQRWDKTVETAIKRLGVAGSPDP
jgi:hypothetical protein